jgi:putative transposase
VKQSDEEEKRMPENSSRRTKSDPQLHIIASCTFHVHLLVEVSEGGGRGVSRMMQRVAGQYAQMLNRRKGHSGPVWEDRFHSTAVDGGRHLWNCLQYLDLNMVRAGVVAHPSEWRWTGYHELVGARKRYRLIDRERLVWRLGRGLTVEALAGVYEEALTEALMESHPRDPAWTESVAVGELPFVQAVAQEVDRRQRWTYARTNPSTAAWVLKEERPTYA